VLDFTVLKISDEEHHMRRKVKKAAKTKRATASRKPARSTSSASHGLEKTLKDLPSKLVAYYRKEVATLKQQEKKLHTDLTKAHTQHKTALKQQTILTAKHKAKPSDAGKKQLSKNKDAIAKHSKSVGELTGKLNQLKTNTVTLAHKQGKYAAIGKQHSALDKEWNQKARDAATKATAPKAPKKRAARKPKTNLSNNQGNTHNNNQENSNYSSTSDREVETSE
jgi:hypothetical protein